MLLLLLNRNWNETKPAEQPRQQRGAPRLRRDPGHTNSEGAPAMGLGVFVFGEGSITKSTPKEKIRVFC